MRERAASFRSEQSVLIPLGVTGGVAEGKSTVVGYLRELGLDCLSADDVARAVWAEASIQDELARVAGQGLPLDRRATLERVAGDPAFRREVNRVLHPEIVARIARSGATVVEVPLLYEGCLQGMFRTVWAVTCGREEQLRRLKERLEDDALVERLLASQLPSLVKCALADEIVRTNLPPFSVHSEVVSLARASGLA